MNKNLSMRIFTSIFLSTLLLICLYFNKYLWLILLITASIISFLEFRNLTKKIFKKKILFVYFSNLIIFLYLTIFVWSGHSIRDEGTNLIFFILLTCIFSDIGGYIIGRTIGGKKLTQISPNKTISGSIGSFFFSILIILVFLLLNWITKNSYFEINKFEMAIYLCLAISFLCQIGDLLISFLKRKAKVKDTGTILPGHGGILDRIDGIMFVIFVIGLIRIFDNSYVLLS